MTTKTMYRIHWKSKLTGTTAVGTELLSQAIAQAWADEMNTKYNAAVVTHWIEPVTVDDPDKKGGESE